MNRLSIRSKLILGFAVCLLCLLVIGGIATQSIHTMAGATVRIGRANANLVTTERILNAAIDAETGMRGFAITGQDAFLAPYHAGVAGLNSQIETLRDGLAGNAAQTERLDQLQAALQQMRAWWQQVIDTRRSQGQRQALLRVQTDSGRQQMDQIRAQLAAIQHNERASALQLQFEYQQAIQHATHTILWGTLLTFLLAGLVTVLMTRDVVPALAAVAAAADLIAEGDFPAALPQSRRADEIGALARAFTRMTTALQAMTGHAERIAEGDLRADITRRSERDRLAIAFHTMIAELAGVLDGLQSSASTVSGAVGEIAAAVHEVNAGVLETDAAITQTAATVEELKQTADLSAQKAKAVSDIAHKSLEVSETGRAAVEQSLAGMRRIRQQTEAIAESIVKLSEYGQSIVDITATVNELAEQSNLLAVNAAIEAAKAGEHGKGFAVVAQEMRSLADQSRQANGQVRAILGQIQRATGAAVMAAEQGAKSVDEGLLHAERSGGAMTQLEQSLADSARAATQIAASSQQQFVGVEQIAGAMDNVKQASLHNIASTHQVQTVVQRLERVGHDLSSILGKYRVQAAGR